MAQNRGASKIFFCNPKKSVEFDGRPSVLELAISKKLPLNHSCGGMGTCGTCRVLVRSPLELLPERNEVEGEMARDRNFTNDERLGCQLEAYDGLEVEIPKKPRGDETP